MERIISRKQMLEKALKRLGQTLKKFETKQYSTLEFEELRDSLIQRFEFSVDTFWKFLMLYLTDNLKVLVQASPKQVFQKALELKLLTDDEYVRCIHMIDDRNMTSHTYNELLAHEISNNIPMHYTVLMTIVDKLNPSQS